MKIYMLKIEARMTALKIHIKFWLSSLANKTEIMSQNLQKIVNSQKESENKDVEVLQQNIKFSWKEFSPKNDTINHCQKPSQL